MKFSVDRLKNMDWKQFAVNHGEKIALSVVGLLVLLIVTKGTRWETFQEKQPEKLLSDVEEQAKLLAAGQWPEEDRKKYTDRYNVNTVYDNTYSVVKADAFKYPPGHPMIWPLHRRQEPIEEPVWLAVQDLIATPGRFILELPPPGQEAVLDGALAQIEKDKTGPLTKAEAIKRQFAATNPQAGGQYGPGGNMDAPVGPAAEMAAYPGGGEGGMMYPGGEGGTMGAQINARGVRYIAVRGVFPFREQAEKIMKARHNPMENNPRDLLQIDNFEIQRQKAKPGPNPWSNADEDWTKLDVNVGLELLREAADYAEEIVDYNNTWYTITSPLPKRLVGYWTNPYVGHPPQIKTMNQAQMELRRMLNDQLVRMEKAAAAESQKGVGGFAAAQRNLFGLQSQVMGDNTQRGMLMNGMTKMMNTENDQNFTMPGEVGMMLNSGTELPEYVLFRYFDYDVKPGEAYRYRVRLRLRNPNFNELADNLVAENVGIGEYRETPWSAPSPIPTQDQILPDDANFFVGDVLAARGRHEAKAKIDLFEWLPEIGTTANKKVEVQIGQIIGQKETPMKEVKKKKDKDKNMADPYNMAEVMGADGMEVEAAPELEAEDPTLLVEILRPYQSLKEEPMALYTKDAVVDLAPPPVSQPRRGFHAELNVKELKPLSQVLIVNEFGELENRNPISQRDQYVTAKMYLRYEHEPWEYLREPEESEDDMGMYPDEMGGGGAASLIEAGSSKSKSKSKKSKKKAPARSRSGANPLRRNRSGTMCGP